MLDKTITAFDIRYVVWPCAHNATHLFPSLCPSLCISLYSISINSGILDNVFNSIKWTQQMRRIVTFCHFIAELIYPFESVALTRNYVSSSNVFRSSLNQRTISPWESCARECTKRDRIFWIIVLSFVCNRTWYSQLHGKATTICGMFELCNYCPFGIKINVG